MYFFLMQNAQRNRRYDSWMKTRCERSRSSRIKNNKVYLQITIFSLIFIVARNLNTIKFKESKEKKKEITGEKIAVRLVLLTLFLFYSERETFPLN